MNKAIGTHNNKTSNILLRHIQRNPGCNLHTINELLGVEEYTQNEVANYFLTPLIVRGLLTINANYYYANDDKIKEIEDKVRESYPPNHGHRWEIEDLIKLCELYYNRDPWFYIAEQLGRSQTACQRMISDVKRAIKLMPHIEANEVLRDIANEI